MERSAHPPDTFVCYAHKDSRQIERDLSWLAAQGVSVWCDPAIPGGRYWRDEIAHAIDQARAVVYFLSASSVGSAHCQREIHFATEHDKPVVPVYLENVRLTAGLELTLSRHQAIFRYRLRRPEYQAMLLAALRPHLRDPDATRRSTDLGPDHAPRPKHAVAVLPFANLSDDPEQAYFGEGLAEDLLDGLSQSRDLIVKARSSSFHLHRRDPATVGRLLSVSHLIQGSVRKAGDRIRINVQLVETADQTIAWSGRFDRRLTDVFAVQDEITHAIVDALDTELGHRADQSPDVSGDAYNAYLRGRYHQERMELRQAIDAYHQAIALEPRYADAHAALAGTHRAMGGPMVLKGGHMSRVRAHLEAALAADPHHPVALSHRAAIRFFVDGDHQTAIYEFDRLLRQYPSTPYGGYQAALHSIGRFDLALRLTGRARRLNPLSPQTHQDRGMHLRDLSRLDEASAAFDEAERLGVAIPQERAEVAFRRRDSDDLTRQLERVRDTSGEASTRFLLTSASLLCLQRRFADAGALLSTVEQSAEDRDWFKALFALRADRSDLAIDYYARALDNGELQAFVFSQPSTELEQLFPDFYRSPARTRMLRSFGLDHESLERLDVPPLPGPEDER